MIVEIQALQRYLKPEERARLWLYDWFRIGVSELNSSLCHSLSSMTSGKELISLCTVAATVKADPHTAFSPWHVLCLRGLDVGWVGMTGWFGAHSNLFPCL